MRRFAVTFCLASSLAWTGLVAWAADEPAERTIDPGPIVSLFELVLDADVETAQRCLAILREKVQSREISAKALEQLRPRLEGTLNKILEGSKDDPLYLDAALLSAAWKNPMAVEAVRTAFASDQDLPSQRRLEALDALIAADDPQVLPAVALTLADAEANPAELRSAVVSALGRLDQPQVADVVLAHFEQLEPELKPKAIELLTQRSSWSKSLMEAIQKQQLPSSALNVNQVSKLLASRDEQLVDMVRAIWGSVRTERNPQREQVIVQMQQLLETTAGNPHHGQLVFNRVCGQCHKMHGQGHDVGPDITVNGRGSFEQLLSNVFDPSLVIGADYQARTVITDDGRVLTGLLAEDSPQRVVLKMQGGKLETIARDEVEEIRVSQLSMMPEGLETQLTPQELADLFAFISLDKPPSDPSATFIPGTPEALTRPASAALNP